ncbi:TNF receptor-associated factor 5-like isoform X2 [Hydractinia symbiolongicarpus]|uniref:TNF receptor-associated factor 5-like isoform X2 n=1 Tax=Hydractinia symbiolongicarpus TaxID=13093 RepID=UPI0025514169|nr:TNF receptor-associated factor 5-like isoform X2 [Hydractinia symbiolongicarpus]
MAESHIRGFDVKLVSSVTGRYKCSMCKLLLREPIQTFRGELACGSCYSYARRKNPSVCPIDGEPIDDTQIFPDRHAKREILQLKCYCNNKENGCPWIGEVANAEGHVSTCDYFLVMCTNCGGNVIKRNLNDHLINLCPKRKLRCDYCQVEIEADLLEDHQNSCAMKPRECPYKCGQAVSQNDLYSHVPVCPKIDSGSTCPYQIIGCKSKAFTSKKNLDKHLVADIAAHTALTVSLVESLKLENEALQTELVNEKSIRVEVEQTVIKQANKIAPLKVQVLILQTQLSDMMKEVSESKQHIEERTQRVIDDVQAQKDLGKEESIIAIQEQMAVVDSQYQEFERKLQNLDTRGASSGFVGNSIEMRRDLDNYAAKIDMIETNNAVISANLSDVELKLQLLENTSYDGRQLWKIDNVRHRMQQAVTGKVTALHSAPCFTSRAGYKFCSRTSNSGKFLDIMEWFICCYQLACFCYWKITARDTNPDVMKCC